MAKKAGDISFVVRSGLCTGCGTCEALCPQHAIRLEIDQKRGVYLPRVDESACNACGLCLRVCPGYEVDFYELNELAFGRQPQGNLLGNYAGCYTGHATDSDIRFNSSSGGLVSALLIFALEKGIIDGVLVTRMNPQKPLEPQPFIARTKEEILSAVGSKYCPVPANSALAEILNAGEGEKFAVVGLPCHMHGLRKAELVNQKLRERVVLHLGLFCGANATLAGARFILERMGIEAGDIAKLAFRGQGWPGRFSAELKNRESKSIVYGDSVTIWSTFFIPRNCQFCLDGTAELSDISFGDAWLPQFANEHIGVSIMLARTGGGQALLDKASAAGVVVLNACGAADVFFAQRGMLYHKKILNQASRRLFSKKNSSGANLPAPNMLDYTVALFQLSIGWYRASPLRSILKRMPLGVMRLYALPFGFGCRYFYSKQTGVGLKGFLSFIFKKLLRIKQIPQ